MLNTSIPIIYLFTGARKSHRRPTVQVKTPDKQVTSQRRGRIVARFSVFICIVVACVRVYLMFRFLSSWLSSRIYTQEKSVPPLRIDTSVCNLQICLRVWYTAYNSIFFNFSDQQRNILSHTHTHAHAPHRHQPILPIEQQRTNAHERIRIRLLYVNANPSHPKSIRLTRPDLRKRKVKDRERKEKSQTM